jgi:hypothetical protein
MAKVKIDAADHRTFSVAAEELGVTVEEWLSDAGRAQALAQQSGRGRGEEPGGSPVAQPADLDTVWAGVLDEFGEENPSRPHRAYLRSVRLRAVVEDTALLSAPDTFTRDVIESRLRPAVAGQLSRALGRTVDVAVTVADPPPGPVREPGPASPTAQQYEQILGRPDVVRRIAAALVSPGPWIRPDV